MRSTTFRKYTYTDTLCLLPLPYLIYSLIYLRFAFHLCLRFGLKLLFTLKNAERDEHGQQQNVQKNEISVAIKYDLRFWIYVC